MRLVPEPTESVILTLHMDKPINFHQQSPLCVHVLSFSSQNGPSYTFDGACPNYLESPEAWFCLAPKFLLLKFSAHASYSLGFLVPVPHTP